MGRLSIYIDESGNGREAGPHVACAVGVLDDAVSFEDAERAFRSAGIKDWRHFHATKADLSVKLAGIRALAKLLDSKRLACVAATTRLDEPSSMDVTHPLVVLSVTDLLEQLRLHLVPKPGMQLSAACDVLLEARDNINHRVLADEIVRRMRKLNAAPRGGHLSIAPRILSLPKGSHPLLQAADLWAHAAQARLRGVLAWPAGSNRPKEVEFDSARLRTPPWRAHVERLTRGLSAAPVRKAKDPATLGSDPIVGRLRDMRLDGESVSFDAVQDLVEELELEQPPFRTARIDGLLAACLAIIEVERDYVAAEDLVSVLDEVVKRASSSREISETTIARWRVRLAGLWILPKNHVGQSAAQHGRIQSARKSCRQLVADPRNWDDIAWLENFVAVNLNDEFLFEEAIGATRPLAEMLAESQDGPFGTIVPRGRHIGALFGTLAQALAFRAHEEHLAGHDVACAAHRLEAVEYSKRAVAHFDEPDDARRHAVYQAHVHMQEALLSGTDAGLADAAACLARDPAPQEAVRQFIRLLPSPRSIVPAFRVAALLKLAWLQGQAPAWHADLAQAVTSKLSRVPAHHPMQQVLGYLALVGPTETRVDCLRQLQLATWPAGLVGTLAAFHAAQAELAMLGRVLEGTRERALANLKGRRKSGLTQAWIHEIESWARDLPREHRPLRVIPFNYC